MRVRTALRVLLALGAAAVSAGPLNAAPENPDGQPLIISVVALASPITVVGNSETLVGPAIESAPIRVSSRGRTPVARNLVEAKSSPARESRCHSGLPCARTAQGYDAPIQFRRSDPAFH